jgi:hypothetical protein
VTLDGTAVGAALDEPGTPVTSTGAVEPDVTAISLALPPLGSIRSALSVIGPAHRLVGPAEAAATAELARTVSLLAADLGLSTGDKNRAA